MTDIILHHYSGSLFSEKIRLLLGYLELPWRSVIIPPIMPRPALMPLTGGYRRTPVMQEGADIYCDTRIISERLAERAGRPELCSGFVANRVAEWADSQLFRVAVAITFQPNAIAATMSSLSEADIAAFQKDRAALTQGAALVTISAKAAESHLRAYLQDLDVGLADTAFLLGDQPTIADFSVYHCLWLIANNPVVAPQLSGFEHVTRWRTRMASFGHGAPSLLAAEDALDIGRRAEPKQVPAFEPLLPKDIALGDQVSVTPTDYGLVPVRGELVIASAREFAVKRHDDLAGEVVVHFPRIGFQLG